MSIGSTDWGDLLEYIDFYENGGDLEPQLELCENNTFLEMEEKIAEISKEVMVRHLQATEVVETALNELKAIPLEAGLKEQIEELQLSVETMRKAYDAMLRRQAAIEQEIAERKARNTLLLNKMEEMQKLLAAGQVVRGQQELITGGTKLCRYLGNTPEISSKRL